MIRAKRLRHGQSRRSGRTSEYKAWCSMHARCYNPNWVRYRDWGGRGIRICANWRKSFAAFFADMGPKPSAKHSIDRKNNDAHYSCGHCEECIKNGWSANCRWATRSEQQCNRRPRRKEQVEQ